MQRGTVNSRGQRWDVDTLQWVADTGQLIGVTVETAIGTVKQGAGGASAWKVDGSAVTQPVSLAGNVNVNLQDGAGTDINSTANALHVHIKANDAGGSGGTSSADDADFVAGTTAGCPAMGVYESTPTNVTDGDMGIVGITQTRRLKTSAIVESGTVTANVSDNATRDNGKIDVASLDQYTPVSGRLPVDGSGVTQPVSAASLPLPTGAATLAEQQTHTTQLTNIEIALSELDDPIGTDGLAAPARVTQIGGRNAATGFLEAFSVDGSGNVNVMLRDTSGNALASATGNPTGTERGLVVRNIPSGTQPVSGTVAVSNTAFAVTKTALTGAAPSAATVGVSSVQAVASNANRKGLVLTNTSSNWIYLGLGNTAVSGSGIALAANGGVWVMDEYTFTTQAINAIATSAGSNLAVQEFS